MSEHFCAPPGFESVIPKNKIDKNVLAKEADAVAKIFNDKIQSLDVDDRLFFMQQVTKNLILSPKQEENFNNQMNANLTGEAAVATTHNLTIPNNPTNANNYTVTTFNNDFSTDQQKANFQNLNTSSNIQSNMHYGDSTNHQKQNHKQKINTTVIRKREKCNVNLVNDWLKSSEKQNHHLKENKTEIKEEESTDPIHSQVENVVEHNTDWLKNTQGQNRNDKKTLNILILGETGVGKSTWINAFANYLIYDTLEEAITAETPICVIPTKFTLFDNNNQCHQVVLGNHENECFDNEGHSATQDAKTYLFETEKYNVYLIDTPGMNDTRGYEQDEENMQKILRAISPFNELHAICFLFKPNESRLKDYFRHSINTLLANLHKTSLNNACFVFTNTRSTFYKPGETLGLLETYFKELNEKEELAVPLGDDNVFCLENEAFRFCCAYFSKVLFERGEIENFTESWKHSSREINRFLDYAATLSPHDTSKMLSVNETRTCIMQLINPIVSVCEIIQTNIHRLEARVEELESLKSSIKELQKRKFVQTVSLEIKPLEKPQIVCKSEKCIRYENIMGNMEPIFDNPCHKECGTKSLFGCIVFGDGGKCRKCKCSYKEHDRIFYDKKVVITDTEIEIDQNQKNSALNKKKMIENAKQMTEKYKDEYDFVMTTMAKFSLFLSQNGIAQKYDIFESHMEDLLKNEEKLLQNVKDYKDEKYYRLADYLMNYKDTREKLFDENIKLSLPEIQDIRQKLFAMPLSGSKIAEIFDIYVKAEENDHIENITRCDKETVKEQSTSWFQSIKKAFFG